MAIYYILIAAILAGGWYLYEYKTSSRAIVSYLAIAGAALVAMATLRYAIGYDYFSYEEIFQRVAQTPWSQLFQNFGGYIGYAVVNKLVAVLGGSYHILLLVCNIFMTAAVFWVIWRYSKLPWISIYLYIALQFFAHSMNLFRQSLAATIIFLSYFALRGRKMIPFFLLVLLAATFHYSALVMLPVYFLINFPVTWKWMTGVGVAALFCYIFSEQIFILITSVIFKSYAHYQNSIYWQGNGLHYVVFPAVYFGITLLFRKALLEKDARNNILINSAFYTFILYVFITRHFILERFSIYVFPLAMILIPEILDLFQVENLPQLDLTKSGKACKTPKVIREQKNRIKNQRFYRNWAIGTVIFICFIYFGFAVARGYHKAYPYVSIFNPENAIDNNDYAKGER